MGSRHRTAGLLGVLALVSFPASAAAETFCVADPGCTGTSKATIGAAVSAASANGSGLDRIQVGPGTFSEPVTVAAGNLVEIDGAGQSATTITRAPANATFVMELGAPGALVSDLTLHLPTGASNMTGLNLAAGTRGERVRVSAAPSTVSSRGVLVNQDSTLARSVVTLPAGAAAMNRGIDAAAGGFVEGGGVTAWRGIRIIGSGVRVRGQRINAHVGIHMEGLSSNTAATIENSQVSGLAPAGAGDAAIEVLEDGFGSPTTTALTARHLTLLGPGGGRGLYAEADSSATATTSLNVSDSLIRGYGTDIQAHESVSGTAAATISNSAFDLTRTAATGGAQVNVVPPNVNLSGVDPRLRSFFGDMRPGFDSPLVDAGVPGALLGSESAVDLASFPRLVDGDGDGTARRDVGAFEYQRSPPEVTASAASSSARIDEPISFGASATDADLDEIPAITWTFDDGANASGGSVEHAFATPGPHTATATATDPAGVTTTATVAVVVDAVPVTDSSVALTIGTRSVRLTRKGVAVVLLTCPATEATGPCGGALTLTTDGKVRRTRRGKPKKVRLGSKAFSIPAGQTANVSVRLSRANRKLVARLKRVRVRGAASFRDRAGNAGTAAARFRLLPPAPRRR